MIRWRDAWAAQEMWGVMKQFFAFSSGLLPLIGSVDTTSRPAAYTFPLLRASSTYGGKMTENIVQAVARDCLAETLKRIDSMGLQVVFHVHDEVIVDAPMETTVDEICGLMAEPIPWAPGLILKGAGFENDYYMKD